MHRQRKLLPLQVIVRNGNGILRNKNHANGVSVGFFLIIFHITRACIYGSYHYISNTWFSGIIIFILLIVISFIGYILPCSRSFFYYHWISLSINFYWNSMSGTTWSAHWTVRIWLTIFRNMILSKNCIVAKFLVG